MREDLVGRRYGRLLVISFAESREKPCGSKYRFWNCLCDCGNTTVTSTGNLTCGATTSCSCYKFERIAETFTKHGDSYSYTYKSYNSMIQRCCNPKTPEYLNYGGAGVTVCDRWLASSGQGYLNFIEDMGERPKGLSINRTRGNKTYSKETCEWVDASLQVYDQGIRGDNTSGVTGVRWNTVRGHWTATIGVSGKNIYLGSSDNKSSAIKLRKDAELKYYGFLKSENIEYAERHCEQQSDS